MAFFERLFAGLGKTREQLDDNLAEVFDRDSIDDDFYDDLEELLILSDIGVAATQNIIDGLKQDERSEHIRKPAALGTHLVAKVKEQLEKCPADYTFEEQRSVVLVVGVNGAGKTTTIGKLAMKYKEHGKKVMIAAADTFRAAALEQLEIWADRSKVQLITGQDGQDPSSVVYDAVSAAKARDMDILLIDTAGRLNNKKNLMEELKKMKRIIDREYPEAYRETLLVLDGTCGQNAVSQARDFKDATDVTGIVITKLDGSSKGGMAIAVQSELSIPVKYIGVGEGTDDLQRFDTDDYVKALFYREDNTGDGDETE